MHRWIGGAAYPIAACLLASALAPAQRTLTLQNLAPHPRAEWFAAAVPFAPGEVTGRPDLHARDHVTCWEPFGARWPDGSLRQAICLVRAELPRLGERELALVPGPGPESTLPAPAAPPCRFTMTAVQGTRVRHAEWTRREVLESNPARQVELHGGRIPETGLVVELIVTSGAGDEHAQCDLAVFHSDPTTKAMSCPLDLLLFETDGLSFVPHYAAVLGMTTEPIERGTRTTLLKATSLGDAQGIRRSGVLVPPIRPQRGLREETLRAAALCPPLAATRWSDGGAFGPFGHVPDVPPWLSGTRLRAAFARQHGEFARSLLAQQPGNPFFCGPHGLARNPNQTGAQNDFGIVKLTPVATTGLPSFLFEVQLSAAQEACRPVHWFTAEGAPLQARDAPDWVVWSGRTHWHCDVSKDRRGKPCPEPAFESHGWFGKDRQHWSTNHLAAYALLTGAHWARRELAFEVQHYLAGQTLRAELTTSGAGAPRGAGRALLAGCWLWLVSGDDALRERIAARIDGPHWHAWGMRELPPERMRPFAVHEPDGRMLEGADRFWTPWQEALAVAGFEACARLGFGTHARELADGLALNLLRHGWRVDSRGAQIASAIRWRDGGEPWSDEEKARRDIVQWADGTDFAVWGIGSVEVGRQAAERAGDTALAARAEQILATLRAGRQAPRDGWFDTFGDWDAIR